MPRSWLTGGSTHVHEVHYDETTRVLKIEFRSGHIYPYEDVPPEVATAFEAADSPGSFFHSEIKGKFEHGPPLKPGWHG